MPARRTIPTVAQALAWARHALRGAGQDTAQLDGEVLLSHVVSRDRAWLYTHPEFSLAPEQMDGFVSLVHRRTAHEPVAYLTGHKEFFGLDFVVTPAVLVPRPETELLVETALELVADRVRAPTVVDVGTGSGVLAVTLAVHLPVARMWATDLSSHALTVARRNAARHGVAQRVRFVQTDLLQAFNARVDLVVSNPPYLRREELSGQLAWEPRAALDGGPDGLAVIRELLHHVVRMLGPEGVLLMELGAAQGPAVLSLAVSHFPRASVRIISDYAGLDRVLCVIASPGRRC
jgi:release factor glutamine methyltransferase